jgi:alkaline phosphatase D
MFKPSRREVIIAGSALALTACGTKPPPPPQGPRPINPDEYDHATVVDFDPASIPENTARFSLGVQAGAMRADSALLWTFTETQAPVKLRVWREVEAAGKVALVTEKDLSADGAGYLKASVDGLAPATWYRFGFFSSDMTARAIYGRFRTAYPDDWNEPLMIGASTCTNFKNMPYETLKAMAKEPIDLFVHLGDMTYTDGAQNLYDFRALWKKTLKDPGYRALVSTVGYYACWDDHEIANDLDPEKLNQTDPTFIPTAKSAFFEALAVEKNPLGKQWMSYRWGKTAEVFVLDCRTERKPTTHDLPDAQYVSPEQLEWLKGALSDSPCHFKVLLNSVPITGLAPIWANGIDRWQGYPAQREKLLGFLDEQAMRNVWFLSGDFHLGMVCRVEKEGPRRRHWEILVGPGANHNNPLSVLLEPGTSAKDRESAFPARQTPFAHGLDSTTTLTFDPKDDSVRVRYLDAATGEARWDQVLRSSEE